MKNPKQENHAKNLRDGFKLVSLDPVEKAGFTFKISGNNYDESVLVIAESAIFGYFACRHFPNPIAAGKWIDGLANTAYSLCKHVIDDK